jgi:hypothetical protein
MSDSRAPADEIMVPLKLILEQDELQELLGGLRELGKLKDRVEAADAIVGSSEPPPPPLEAQLDASRHRLSRRMGRF